MSKNTNHLVILRETKEIKDKILGSYYSWAFTVAHGCSPMGTTLPEVPEIPEILEIWQKQKIFWVLCNICVWSIEYQLFPTITPRINQINMHSTFISIKY